MPVQLLTTGKVARLCSVQPDTVLKWIKKGRIAATRTAGGHYRVDEHEVAPLLSGSKRSEDECPAPAACACRPLRCWEYLSDKLRDECKECVAYQMRSSCCFELVKLVRGAGHSKCFAAGLCQDCPYYRRVRGQPANVLLVTGDESLIQNIASSNSACVACRFARNGYDASAIISVFRPALVVVGENIAAKEPGLIDALASDPRALGMRILLGVRKTTPASTRRVGGPIAGIVERPFRCGDLFRWIDRFPVEPLEEGEAASGLRLAPARIGGRRSRTPEPIPA